MPDRDSDSDTDSDSYDFIVTGTDPYTGADVYAIDIAYGAIPPHPDSDPNSEPFGDDNTRIPDPLGSLIRYFDAKRDNPGRDFNRADRVADLHRDLESVNWPWREYPGRDGDGS